MKKNILITTLSLALSGLMLVSCAPAATDVSAYTPPIPVGSIMPAAGLRWTAANKTASLDYLLSHQNAEEEETEPESGENGSEEQSSLFPVMDQIQEMLEGEPAGTEEIELSEFDVEPLEAINLADNSAPLVTAYGTYEKKFTADTIDMSIAVDTANSYISTTKHEHDLTVRYLLEGLRHLGISQDNVSIGSINIYSSYDKYAPGEEDAYSVSTTLRLTDIPVWEFTNIAAMAFDAGASGIYDVTYHLSNYAEMYEECLKEAVQTARRKASILAEANGYTLGDLNSVTELTDGYVYPEDAAIYIDGMHSFAGDEIELMPGKITVTCSVGTTYELEPDIIR